LFSQYALWASFNKVQKYFTSSSGIP
jgi:hypothetical protein